MSNWKIFSKNKEKIEETNEPEETQADEPILEEATEQEEVTYSETLNTSSSSSKNKKELPAEQRSWRNVEEIEKNVDNIHIRRAQRPVTDLDRTVERVLEKRKKK